MDTKLIEAGLDVSLGGDFRVFESIDSTNSYLRREADSPLPDGYVVCALSQTAGRGRFGKTFISPPGGIYLSVLLRPAASAEKCACITAWAAVAVCSAIEKVCHIQPRIKWVNDIVLGRRKICGILSELAFTESGGVKYVIIGVGVNVNTRAEHFSGELCDIATSIFEETGVEVDEAALCAEIALQLRLLADSFPNDHEEILASYRAYSATVGSEIFVLTGEDSITAHAEAIDDSFHLVVREEDGTRRTLIGGDVSVRGLCGYV